MAVVRGFRRLAALALALAGCAPPAPAKAPGDADVCGGVARCAAEIAEKVDEGEVVDERVVRAYVAARRAADADDAWTKAWDRARGAAHDRVVRLGGSLPAPGGVSVDALLVAFADALDVPVLARPGPGGLAVVHGRDPLAPFSPRGPRADAMREADLDAAVKVEIALRRVADAARAGQYVDAAHRADELREAGSRATGAAAARAQAMLARLGAAGLVLDAPEAPAGPTPSRAKADGAPVCAETRASPTFDHPRDLTAAAALALAPEAKDLRARADRAAGLARAAKTAARSGASWAYAPLLLGARGLPEDARAALTRATLLHVRGLIDVAHAEPGRFSTAPTAALGAAMGSGDAALTEEVGALVERAIEGRIRAAKTPSEVLTIAAASAFAGAGYPPEIRTRAVDAALRATEARLTGDLARAAGFDAALLHAANVAARAALGRDADFGRASRDVTRALELEGGDAGAGHELARLGAAFGRYAVLASSGRLAVAPRGPGPRRADAADREAARADLRAAIAGLGPADEAPKNLVDDVTDLADGLAAALALVARESRKAPAAKAPGAACADGPRRRAKGGKAPDEARTGPSAAVLRALAPLRDVRLRVLSHPRFRGGDGLWVRRARLLVTLLSDAIDVAERGARHRPGSGLALPRDEARRYVEGALEEGAAKPYAKAIAGAYAIARAVVVDRGRRDAPAPTSAEVAGVARDFAAALARARGGAALAAIASLDAPTSPDAVSALLARWTRALSAAGARDEADLALLLALVVEAVSDAAPSADLRAAAHEGRSRVAWALDLVAEMDAAQAGRAPRSSAFADELARAAPPAACAPPKARLDPAVEVADALADAVAGKRDAAAKRLDGVLARAERDGLDLTRVAYRFEARAPGRVVGLSFDVSSGFGVLRGATNFQVDLGVTSTSRDGASLSSSAQDPASPDAVDEAARYYVAVAALASAYNFASGDDRGGVRDAARAVAAVTRGVRLGDRSARPAPGRSWAADARPALTLAAELAAAHGDALLAGELWALVVGSVGGADARKTLQGALNHVPAGFASADPVVVRARASLGALEHALPCGPARDPAGFEEVTCAAYPRALGLRAADALKQRPRLARGKAKGTGAACEAFVALDRFLVGADQRTYDPDAFTRAAKALDQVGLHYDAATLLARYKKRGHCSGGVVGLERRLGADADLGPALHAELLGDVIACTSGAPGASFADDVVALDRAAWASADAPRALHLMLTLGEVAARDDRWPALAALVTKTPGFVERWIGNNDAAATAALALARASFLATPAPHDKEALALAEGVLCASPPASRAALCQVARDLGKPDADLARAKRAILDVVVRSAPPKP